MNYRHKDMGPKYHVLKSYCNMLGWNSKEYIIKHLSRVDIELIRASKVFLFCSRCCTIEYDDSFLQSLNMFHLALMIKQPIILLKRIYFMKMVIIKLKTKCCFNLRIQ
jgi:hypothetical protein